MITNAIPKTVARTDRANVFTRKQEVANDPATGSPCLYVHATTSATCNVLSVGSHDATIFVVTSNPTGHTITATGLTRAIATTATQVPLTVSGNVAQTANLQDWKVGATAVASVDAAGRFVGDGSLLTNLPVSSGSTGVWAFSTSTVMADPGSGKLRADAAAFAAVTQLALSAFTDSGIDAGNRYRTAVAGDTLYVQDQDNSANYARYTLSAAPADNASWFLIPVTPVGAAGTGVGNNAKVLVELSRQGSIPANVARTDAANTFTAAPQTAQAFDAVNPGLVVRAASPAATANLQEWRDWADAILARVSAGGVFTGAFQGDGSLLTGVPAPANVAYRNQANTFTVGPQTVQAGVAGNVCLKLEGIASGSSAALQQWWEHPTGLRAYFTRTGNLFLNGADSSVGVLEIKSHTQMADIRFLHTDGGLNAMFGTPAGAGGILTAAEARCVCFRSDEGPIRFGRGGSSKVRVETASDGRGTDLRIEGQSTTQTRPQAELVTTYTDATDATRKTRFAFRVYDTIARDVLRVDTTAGAPNIAVGGAAVANVNLIVHNGAQTYAGLVVRAAGSQSANIQEWQDSAGVVLGSVSENGYWTTRKTAAPADAELAAGELALWLDATNGAAKLMVKAKQADGTVRTGSVALT